MNYDNSLIEVWKWKERVYEDTKGMSVKEVPFATGNSRNKNDSNYFLFCLFTLMQSNVILIIPS